MIAAARIKELLNQQPFRPFRVFLSDGSKHDVPHPEFAWVFGGRMFIGVPVKNALEWDGMGWSRNWASFTSPELRN